jgi:phospholipid/cholesterol/gamma-HCH transport system ATP-binding protein
MADHQPNSPGVSVTVHGLRKSFNRQVVLNGIDLDVSAGEIFAIIGPSGSGKTMLLKHLIGLEKPDAGEILINGQNAISNDILGEYRVAMVFQTGALLNSLTVGENVGLYLREHRLKPEREIQRIVSEKLEAVGLQGLEGRYPNELSGGQVKRVAIARALVVEPQLILYDEPTSELDPLMAVTIAEEIIKLKKRVHLTSIVVTHDRHVAFGIADRLAFLDAGKILAVGTPEALQSNPTPAIQRFLTAEFNPANHP